MVRHGETDWNKEGRYQGELDIPLNDKGKRQAEMLAKALSSYEIDVIYSSPLRRALETAKIIDLEHRAPIFVKDELKEISHGKWEGLLLSEVKERYAELYDAWKREPEKVIMPDGESLEMVYRRVAPFLEELKKRYRSETILIAGHDGVNKVIFCVLLELPLSYFWRFKQDNASFSILETISEDGKFCLRHFNDICHLSSLGETVEGAL